MKSLRKAILYRHSFSPQGTLGAFFSEKFKCYTIELPWWYNKSNISCIPKGIYTVRWSRSNRFKRYMYEICDVPDRGGIRIHAGNFAGDEKEGYITHSQGCPLMGESYGKLKNQLAVVRSGIALEKFEDAMKRESFLLEIKWISPVLQEYC